MGAIEEMQEALEMEHRVLAAFRDRQTYDVEVTWHYRSKGGTEEPAEFSVRDRIADP